MSLTARILRMRENLSLVLGGRSEICRVVLGSGLKRRVLMAGHRCCLTEGLFGGRQRTHLHYNDNRIGAAGLPSVDKLHPYGTNLPHNDLILDREVLGSLANTVLVFFSTYFKNIYNIRIFKLDRFNRLKIILRT